MSVNRLILSVIPLPILSNSDGLKLIVMLRANGRKGEGANGILSYLRPFVLSRHFIVNITLNIACPVILTIHELAVFATSPVKSFFHELTSRFAMIADCLGFAETVKNKNRRCYERYAPSDYPRMLTQAYWEKLMSPVKLIPAKSTSIVTKRYRTLFHTFGKTWLRIRDQLLLVVTIFAM